jgi:NTP pyrophosphatase (non-canonical NTP hydrolase)
MLSDGVTDLVSVMFMLRLLAKVQMEEAVKKKMRQLTKMKKKRFSLPQG